MKVKTIAYIQLGLISAGVLWAWFNVVKNFIRFYKFEGTIFKIHNCVIPNPVTEPCFYGALGFAAAWIIAYTLVRSYVARVQYRLWWFAFACTVFAWTVVTKEMVSYFGKPLGAAVGCSAIPIYNPFMTPCFIGATLFLMSVFVSGYIYFHNKT